MLSPAGRAVGVDTDGRVVGVVPQSELGTAVWAAGADAASATRMVGVDG